MDAHAPGHGARVASAMTELWRLVRAEKKGKIMCIRDVKQCVCNSSPFF
jgi:hypothetical protein